MFWETKAPEPSSAHGLFGLSRAGANGIDDGTGHNDGDLA
jgi:hypothetical protein